MIVKRTWRKKNKIVYGMMTYRTYTGWFLFGVIPLYVVIGQI